ncbi:hypothetical protein BDV98DRAFT_507900, partial [Pterulicium gracile]
GEYYHEFVPIESIMCPCDGNSYQDRAHVRECSDHLGHRWILRKVSEDIALPDILGTPEGIKALAKFLNETGAFTKTGRPPSRTGLPAYEDEPSPNFDPEPPDIA